MILNIIISLLILGFIVWIGWDLVKPKPVNSEDAPAEQSPAAGKKQKAFDLFSDNTTKSLVFVIGLLIVYAVVDSFLYLETYLSTPPYLVFIVAGIAVALVAGWLAMKSNAPKTETIGMALITGAVFSLAMHPALLRINALTASEDIKEYEYAMTDKRVFSHIEGKQPDVIIDIPEYTRDFYVGEKHSFRLRKGGLGFYQLDIGDILLKVGKWRTINAIVKQRFNSEPGKSSAK